MFTTLEKTYIMHKTKNDIPETKRIELIALLNKTLAYLIDLKLQVKQAHWNVKGMRFIALHELFDMLALELDAHIDTTAERATSLAGVALGTLQQVSQNTVLEPYPLNAVSGEDHLEHLTLSYSTIGTLIRSYIKIASDEYQDQDTADIFTEVSRSLDLRLWFLEAHIQD